MHKRFCISIVFILSYLDCGRLYADDANEVVIVDRPLPITVSSNWSSETMSEIYGSKPSIGNSGLAFLFDQTPFSAMQFTEEVLSSFSEKAQVIANGCKKVSPEVVWLQIACVSQSIKKTFLRYKWPSTSTFCRAHSQAFIEVFRKLNIPHSQAFMWDASTDRGGHVVNRLTLTDVNGRFFLYVIDVGWRPNQVFPLAEFTREYHAKEGRILPEVKYSEPDFMLKPACKNSSGDLRYNFKSIWKATERAL